jgi:hypothetical protein
MNRNDAFPSRFFKAEDVKDKPAVVTIASVITERIGQDNQEKLIMLFEDSKKQLVINATNFDAIAEITGEDDSDNWAGYRIALVPKRVDFAGKKVDAIRVRAAAQAPKTPAKHSESSPTFGDEPPPVESEDDFR